MRGSTARITFFIVCIALAVLALLKVFTTILTGVIFALVLVVLGLASRGFSKKE